MNELGGVPAEYYYRTVDADLFGGNEGYISEKEKVLEQIKKFCEKERKK